MPTEVCHTSEPPARTMPTPHWSDAHLTIAAMLAALPCGYGFGVVAAFLLAGGYGLTQAWLVTVPLSLLAATRWHSSRYCARRRAS